ncbi:MAG: hypothetical protein K5685_06840 [Bacteroidales bacterium]|nr:hypothetical protein [Bacteroidales bacterium]
MADLENIRGNYLTQELGNFPLDCECLDYLQQRDDLAAVLGNIAGDRVILQGLESDGSGIVFLKTRLCPKGEILPVEKGSGNYLVVTETDIAVNFSAVDKFPKAHTKTSLCWRKCRQEKMQTIRLETR